MSEALNVNIASHLPEMARRQPHTAAVVFPEGRDPRGRVSYTHLTYRQLDEDSNRIASGLTRAGVERGMRTVLMVKPSLEFFALTFALFKIGAVPVMVDPGMGIKNLGQCLREAAPHAFIGIPRAHLARKILAWGKQSLEIFISVGPRLLWQGRSLDQVRAMGDVTFEMADTRPEETAAILFTSGSTGVPKGVVYSHSTFDAQVRMIREAYGIEPGEIDLPTFPLFALFAPALGMTAIIPDMDATRPAQVDPRKIIEAIEDFGVTNMFGSPAVIRRVGQFGSDHDIKLPTLRRVISAGAPASPPALARFQAMLSGGAQIHTPYGATEALPVSSIGSLEILEETAAITARGAGVCVGAPVSEADVRIIPISDDVVSDWQDDLGLPAGEIGEIVVRGPMVTREYFHREDSTRLAKIRCEGGILHRMGDLGYFDDRGRIWFCGRKAHRVITSKKVHFTISCEGVFNAHEDVFRSALVGVPSNGDVEPVLCVELEKNKSLQKGAAREKISRELLALGGQHESTRDIRKILFHPSFPVDIRHNAKIFREKLATWARTKMP